MFHSVVSTEKNIESYHQESNEREFLEIFHRVQKSINFYYDLIRTDIGTVYDKWHDSDYIFFDLSDMKTAMLDLINKGTLYRDNKIHLNEKEYAICNHIIDTLYSLTYMSKMQHIIQDEKITKNTTKIETLIARFQPNQCSTFIQLPTAKGSDIELGIKSGIILMILMSQRIIRQG
jgi:hypothetical protein